MPNHQNKFVDIIDQVRIKSGHITETISLSAMDRFQSPIHVSQLFLFRDVPEVDSLKASLSEVLKSYPIFTGQLISNPGGKYLVECCDNGVHFETRRLLHGMNYFENREMLTLASAHCSKSFFPDKVVDQKTPLLAVTLTKLMGGGAILSVANSHCTGDLPSITRFLSDWGRVHRKQPIRRPIFDRNSMSQLVKEYANEVDHTTQSGFENICVTEPNIHHKLAMQLNAKMGNIKPAILSVPKIDVAQLKKKLSEKSLDSTQWVSQQDILTAILWLATFRTLDTDSALPLSTVFNYRAKRDFNIPIDFIGNTIASRMMTSSLDVLNQANIHQLALFVRQAGASVNPTMVAQDIAFLDNVYQSTSQSAFLEFLNIQLEAGLSINNLSKLKTSEIDFGFGPPLWYNPPLWPIPRIMHVLPATLNANKYHIHTMLPQSEVQQLQSEVNLVISRQLNGG